MKTQKIDKKILITTILAITFYFALLRIDFIISGAKSLFKVIKPFVYGGIIAFVVNVPMMKIEKKLSKTKLKKGHRPLAFLLTVILMIAVISGFLLFVLPQLAGAINTLIARLQVVYDQIPGLLQQSNINIEMFESFIGEINVDWRSLGQNIINYVKNISSELLQSSTSLVSSVANGFATLFLSVIFSIYVIFGKEKIAAGLKEVICVTIDKKYYDRLFHVLSVVYRNFSSFLSGQCLEAVILGTMFVVVLSVFRMPYAVLIGVIIAVTALIPVIGAFIGCGIGILLIVLESPVQALWFIVIFLVLQQIEGNLVYPHVVGNSIGLPSILVFMSVVLGGNLMGVTGILVFIPLVSVVYTLVKEFVLYRKNLLQPADEPTEK